MVTLFIRHTVANFAAWRQAFEEFAAAFESLEVRGHAVYQGIANPDDLTIAVDFDRLVAAQVFVMHEGLKPTMDKAGAGPPTIWFASKV